MFKAKTLLFVQGNNQPIPAKESYLTIRNRVSDSNLFVEITTDISKLSINKEAIGMFGPSENKEKK